MMYGSVASPNVFKACFVHCWGCLAWNLSAQIPDLAPSQSSIAQIVWTDGWVVHGGCLLRAAIIRTCCPLCIPAVHQRVSWWPFTLVWSYSHPIACCVIFLVFPVIRTFCQCQLTGVSVVAVSQRVAHWMKHLSIGSIRIRSHLAEVLIELWYVVVGLERKIITKRIGKSRGIYCLLQVTMEWVTANSHILLKMNPTAYSCMLQGFPTVLRFVVSRSDVVC